MTSHERLRRLSRFPLVVAPMAGGPTTPALVIAAAEAGALGFLAAGYKSAAEMRTDIAAVRRATSDAFGVNVFVPGEPTLHPEALAAYVGRLGQEADELAVALGAPRWDDDEYDAKLDVLLAAPPPLVSFTFGCPSTDVVRSLQAGGSMVVVTVTTPAEAVVAQRGEVDGLCLQGIEAGAHRGSFANDDRPGQDYPLGALLAHVQRECDLPLIAAGGIADAQGMTAALAAGATQVQLGTAFLRSTESGAHALYKAALADPHFTSTAITRAFSGRRARSLVNAFLRAHEDAPPAYPEINHVTRPLRAAAMAANDPEHMSLYAGEGFRQAEERSAGEIIEQLAAGLKRSGVS
jgi:nitronate monooxygenase